MEDIKFKIVDEVGDVYDPYSIYDVQSGAVKFTTKCKFLMYTGLKDVDGKEIYEGDIVKWDDSSNGSLWRIAVVEWDSKGQWCFSVKKGVSINCYKNEGHDFGMGTFMYSPNPKAYGNQLFVIGNIYETPELIIEVKQ